MMQVPSTPPTLDRQFQCTDLGGNHNKYWRVRRWSDSGITEITYGRVGTECARPLVEVMSEDEVRRRIQKKLDASDKGSRYREIELAAVSTGGKYAVNTVHEKRVVEILRVANEEIEKHLAVKIDKISLQHLERATSVLRSLDAARNKGLDFKTLEAVEEYYSLVPTVLPRKIDHEAVAKDLISKLSEEEDRLKSLKAAVETATQAKTEGQLSIFDVLGARLFKAEDEDWVRNYVETTKVHEGYKRAKIREIHAVEIPEERKAYEVCTVGKNNVKRLFHGTRSYNVRHIMKSGLICPTQYNTSRLFGHGLYYADVGTKSLGYTEGYGTVYLFVCEVALGNQYKTYSHMYDVRQAPSGYDSVMGEAGKRIDGVYRGALSYNEYIVYRKEQQTIRYVVVLDI
jgi:poly [ADP-ribose] polymerase 2/3/4